MHSFLCNHASSSIEDMVLSAIKEGYEEIGISEHVCYPPASDIDDTYRLKYQDLEYYIEEVNRCKIKYSKKIKILLGFEAEYLNSQKAWLKKLFNRPEVDYFILGNHFIHNIDESDYVGRVCTTPEKIQEYADNIVIALETKMFSMITHPELFMKAYFYWDSHCEQATTKIIDACLKYDVALEINGLGIYCGKQKFGNDFRYMYPHDQFWRMVEKTNAKVMVSSDAHDPAHLRKGHMRKVYNYAKHFHINIIDKIILKK